jgi:N-acetylglutamate synthase-like GNAT family acetyltransferase
METYLIRAPNKDEIYEALVVMYRSFDRSIPSDIDNEAKLLIDLINSNIAKFLIAEKEKKIFGLGAFFLFQDICSIGYMSVLPEFRNKGVGTRIFNDLVSLARTVGCKTFLLYASKLGESIYHKFGFRSNYSTTVYEFPDKSRKTQELNENVKICNTIPEWVAELDKETMGFNRLEFLKTKLRYGTKLIIVSEEGFALISGKRIGPLIAKNLDTAVDLINMGISLGVKSIIVPKHIKFPNKLFNLIELHERENENNLKMIYGKRLSQRLDYFYALGTYSKG